MLTSLDLLVILFMVLSAVTLLSVSLMFLIRNKTVKRVCFYLVLALALYLASVGIRIGWGMFPGQVIFGFLAIAACVAAFLIERIGKQNEKMLLIARILSAVTLIVALANAIF